ncbi:MAG: N-acetyltransferase family protein [Pseudomonadota bacterium]
MLEIRRARRDDADFIADTYRPFVENHWASFETEAPSPAIIAERLSKAGDQYPWLIAEDGSPLAYAYASPHRTRAAYQTSVDTAIYCANDARGKGVGKMLYGKLLEVLTAQNYTMAFGGVAMPNDASVCLHQVVGFELIGTYPNVGFKHAAWRDTTWWSKRLAEPVIPPEPIKPVSEVFNAG